MRKPLVAAIAAITFGGAVAASAQPAEARDYRRHRDRDNDAAAAAIVAGVAGLAIGAALGSSSRNRSYYGGGYYDPRYSGYGYGHGYGYAPSYGYAPRYGYGYAPSYGYSSRGYGYGYRTCPVKERVRDPYTGRRITIRRQYRC